MKKNEYFTGKCLDYTYDGKGIVKNDGFAYFVEGMILGEVGKIKCLKVLKHYGIGRLVEIIEPAKERVNPKCHIYQGCGSCHLMHLNQQGQQLFKTKRVKDCFLRIAGLELKIQPCIMQESPWFYRNKVQMPLGYNKAHQLEVGYYKQRTNDLMASDNCLTQNQESNKIIQRVKELLIEYQIEPYNKVTHQGNIKHLLTKRGYHSQEIMLCFITYQAKIKHIQAIVETLVKEFPNIKTIIQNINQRHDNVIIGEQEIILYGDGYIFDTLLGNKYKISLKSFYQINPIQVEILYQKAISLANLNKNSVVLDAYCGIGTITLSVAKYVKKVYGVEIVKEAIDDAKSNALLNGIDNVEFICDDAGAYLMSLVKKQFKVDVVFVDPPRKGCSKQFIDYLLEASPQQIVYISCDVSTQARDVKLLIEAGYRVADVQPVDMFPQTYHVESVVLLTKVHKKKCKKGLK